MNRFMITGFCSIIIAGIILIFCSLHFQSMACSIGIAVVGFLAFLWGVFGPSIYYYLIFKRIKR